jgi:hypothetical protein
MEHLCHFNEHDAAQPGAESPPLPLNRSVFVTFTSTCPPILNTHFFINNAASFLILHFSPLHQPPLPLVEILIKISLSASNINIFNESF